MKTRTRILTAAILAGLTIPALAFQAKRASPHESINANINGSRVQVVYGRPYSADPKTKEKRKIWGGLVPFGKVWRMGANEATILASEANLQFGDVTVPAGAYTLYMWPNEDGSAKLIINKVVGTWGAYTYREDQDVARIDMKKETIDPAVDQFTIALTKEGDGAVLKASWDTLAYSVPFKVIKK